MSEDLKDSTLNINDTIYETKLSKKYQLRKPYSIPNYKLISAFIPGVIQDIHVKPGQDVIIGEKLLILEAMKMKNIISSSINGKVKTIYVSIGQKVVKGEILVELE